MGDPLKDASANLSAFEKQLGSTRSTLKRVQTRQKDDGFDLSEASQHIKAIADNSMNAALAPALVPYSQGLHELASVTVVQAEHTKRGLLFKLKLFKALAEAAQEQFKRRAAVGASIDSMNGKIKELLAQSTKVAGKSGKEKQVAELEAKASGVQAQVSEARATYASYTATLSWELERYNERKNRELIICLQEHALAHTAHASKLHEVWGTVSAGITGRVASICGPGGASAETYRAPSAFGAASSPASNVERSSAPAPALPVVNEPPSPEAPTSPPKTGAGTIPSSSSSSRASASASSSAAASAPPPSDTDGLTPGGWE